MRVVAASCPTAACVLLRASRRRRSAVSAVAGEAQDADTVAAIVTPVVPQAGGVAIVRLSGSRSVEVVGRLFRPGRTGRHAWAAESHRAESGCVCDVDGSVVDEARRPASPPPTVAHPYQVLVLPMLAPRSYTREDVVEIHCHGGSICVQRVLALCLVRQQRSRHRASSSRCRPRSGRVHASPAPASSRYARS